MKVTTSTGFACEIDKDRLDDWEFAKAAAAATNGGGDALNLAIYMVDHMMSKEDAKRLEDHVKTEDGRIPTSRIMEEVTELLNGAAEKN